MSGKGGYIGGILMTGFFFLLLAIIAGAILAGIVFAFLTMPITMAIILTFLLFATIATWRAKRRHDRRTRIDD